MTRGYKGTLSESREAIGAPWMNRAEVSQSIPPAYTRYIGEQLLAHLSAVAKQQSLPSSSGSSDVVGVAWQRPNMRPRSRSQF